MWTASRVSEGLVARAFESDALEPFKRLANEPAFQPQLWMDTWTIGLARMSTGGDPLRGQISRMG